MNPNVSKYQLGERHAHVWWLCNLNQNSSSSQLRPFQRPTLIAHIQSPCAPFPPVAFRNCCTTFSLPGRVSTTVSDPHCFASLRILRIGHLDVPIQLLRPRSLEIRLVSDQLSLNLPCEISRQAELKFLFMLVGSQSTMSWSMRSENINIRTIMPARASGIADSRLRLSGTRQHSLPSTSSYSANEPSLVTRSY